jgi:hypothetical protein
MKERPIIFSSPMVKAILDGRKTMTRRVIKCRHELYDKSSNDEFRELSPYPLAEDKTDRCHYFKYENGVVGLHCPYGIIGDRLWARENIYFNFEHDNFYYSADRKGLGDEAYRRLRPMAVDLPVKANPYIAGRTIPSIFMPRWASRITLEITDVRAERLQEISRGDAIKEGLLLIPGQIEPEWWKNGIDEGTYLSPIVCFRKIWDSINGKKYPWASNPWVWVISFKRVA